MMNTEYPSLIVGKVRTIQRTNLMQNDIVKPTNNKISVEAIFLHVMSLVIEYSSLYIH